LSFGFGYSTADGVLGDISIRERNLLGRGQDLRLGFLVSQRRQEIDLSFTEPYFMDRELAAGIDVFKRSRDLTEISGYEEHNTGFILRGGYQLTESLRHLVRYTLRQDELTDLDSNVSRFIRAQAGKSTMSAVGQDLTYDKRDDRFDPTEGYYVRLSTDVAGVGGDAKFLRNRLTVGTYYSIVDEWVASLTGEVGYLEDMGEKTRIQHRFFLGGDSLRGFSNGGVGPRETSRGASLGGHELYAGSAELTFPSGLPKEIGIRTSVFSDFGTLTDSGESGPDVQDTQSIRVSTGVGALWRSPFGPVKVSFAKAIRKESFDKTETFRFSFGSRF
jgi:outer membrane protein insertion porin family